MSENAAAAITSLASALTRQKEEGDPMLQTLSVVSGNRRAPVQELIDHVLKNLLPKLPQVKAAQVRASKGADGNALPDERILRRWTERTVTVAYRQTWRELVPGLADGAEIDLFQVDVPEDFSALTDQADKAARRQVLWHIRRLMGFGGSEAGVLRAFADKGAAGESQGRQNPHNLILSKLCMRAPEDDTPDTIRGRNSENWIRQEFRRRFGVIGRDDLIKELQAVRLPGMPWHVVNLDDVVENDRGLWIVDYKAPNEENSRKYVRDGISEDWIDQLHWYAIGALRGEKPVPLAGMILVMQDATTRELIPFEVEFDPARADRILEGAAKLWNEFVMEGALPGYATPRPINIDGGAPRPLSSKMDRLVGLKTIESQVKKMVKDAEIDLSAAIRAIGPVGDDTIELRWGKITADKDYNIAGLKDMLAGMGGDPEAYRIPGAIDEKATLDLLGRISAAISPGEDMNEEQARAETAARLASLPRDNPEAFSDLFKVVTGQLPRKAHDYDGAAMAAEIVRLEGDPSAFISEDISFRVNQSKAKGPTVEFKQAVAPAVDMALASFRDLLPELPAEPEPEAAVEAPASDVALEAGLADIEGAADMQIVHNVASARPSPSLNGLNAKARQGYMEVVETAPEKGSEVQP